MLSDYCYLEGTDEVMNKAYFSIQAYNVDVNGLCIQWTQKDYRRG